jgi:hypothetical protein
VIVVGDSGTIVHDNGKSWNVLDSGTRVTLTAVWSAAAGDAYVVGYWGTILHGVQE